jgi:NADH:ubiquinone oxidoreductase subunit 5 (subunit L)/multisubunit Na+/H+ antiporter MnhA subunit
VAGLTVCRTLLLLSAAAAQEAAGTRRLDRLGGLIHRMPVTAACTLAGLFGVVALPVGFGFAAFWLLVQSLLSTARIGGFSLQILIAAIAALIALSMGLSMMAAVRLFGVAFLGRPRTPRTAAADEITLPRRASLTGLAVLSGLLGLLPGLALAPAWQALSMLTGAAPNGRWLLLMLGSDQVGYAALPLAGLLAFAAAAMLVWLSRRGVAEHRREPAWSGGFAAPPAWLPFGDPATQISAASFAEPVRDFLEAGAIVTCESVVTLAKARVQGLRTTAAVATPDFPPKRHLDARLREHDVEAAGVTGLLVVLALLLAFWLVAS